MKYGLIGERLAHSHSPAIHKALGNDEYQLKSLPPDDLAGFLIRHDFKGINVTIPYKLAVMPFCATLSPAAARIGSVNTIVVDDSGALHGHNTDYQGFLYMVRSAGLSLRDKKILILGSGGTSKTVQTAAVDQGARQVLVVSRTGAVNYETILEHADSDIIINTTPVGMFPNFDECPINLQQFPNCCGVLDVVYNPLTTRLLSNAKALGIPCANGLSMLVAQAKYASDLFFDQQAPDNMIGTVLHQITANLTNIVLIGMPGSGKTSIGNAVADRLERPFVDLDQIIAEKAGQSIPEIFAQKGETAFRELESEVIKEYSGKNGLVIAPGGGAILQSRNAVRLRQNSLLFHIHRNIDQLELIGRPLSRDLETVNKMHMQRLPLYQKYSDGTINNDGTIEQAVNEIMERFYEIIGH